ncbi:MAG: hypothetical protein ACI9SP_002540 [Arenicella sp.]
MALTMWFVTILVRDIDSWLHLTNLQQQTLLGTILKSKFMALFLSIFVLAYNSSNAQVVEMATSATVDSVITKLTNSVSEIISEAEASGTVLGFSIATDAKILIQNIEALGSGLSGKIFSDLTRAQQTAFENAASLLNEADYSAEQRLEQIELISKGFGAELSRLPGVDDRPLILSYGPSYIFNTDAAYDITLNGSLLNSERADLTFGATPCKLISSVESQLKFTCPAEIFSTGENEWVSGRINLIKPAPWYTFWKDETIFQYTIGVMAIQEAMGEYSLKVWENRPTALRVARSQKNNYRNGHCKGNKSKVWSYRPATNCSVDVTSVKVTSKHVSSKSTFEGLINVSSNGFQTRGKIRNNGQCGPFGVGKDGRGALNVTVKWFDECKSSEEIALDIDTGALSWQEDKSFELPETMTKFVLTIMQKNGETKVVNGTSSEKWFATTFSPDSKILTFKPRDIERAFK